MFYKVLGSDESVENIDILGEVRKVGDIIELDEETAASLVEEGKLELDNVQIADDQNDSPVEEVTPTKVGEDSIAE